MAVSQKIRNRLDETVAELKTSKAVSLTDKDDYIEILTEAAEGTNGLSIEEKTQANSVNIFNLCYLFIRDRLDAPKSRLALVRDICVACRWQITIIALGLCAVLAFRPQFAAIIESLFKGM